MRWRWINRQTLILLHDESLTLHGGSAGLRDEGLLESALARPLNAVAYASADNQPDVSTLAASYATGLAKNHPFVDGNKRAAFLATGLFFYLNGYGLNASQADATLTVIGLAAGDVIEEEFAGWLRSHAVKRT